MKEMKLIPLSDFVNDVLTYVNESHNYERGIKLIKWYSELLDQPLSLDMFIGDNPLFEGFHLEKMNAKKGYDKVSSEHIGLEIFIKKEGNYTIDLLSESGLEINIMSEYAETDLFD